MNASLFLWFVKQIEKVLLKASSPLNSQKWPGISRFSIILSYVFSTTTLEGSSSPAIVALGPQQNEVRILPLFPTHPCLPVLLRSH